MEKAECLFVLNLLRLYVNNADKASGVFRKYFMDSKISPPSY